MKLTFQSEVRTRRSKKSVRLSGVFTDAAGVLKGLTVLRVLPGAAPCDELASKWVEFQEPIFFGERLNAGVLDPFWWQDSEVAEAERAAPFSLTGGAMTCLFTLAPGIKPDDERWLKGRAKIAPPEDYVDKSVRLSDGAEIGVIVDELNHLPLGARSVYPLLKLRRSMDDLAADVGIRNGAMVFAQDGGLIGIIVATFGAGEFYSVAPLEDVLEWHALSFLSELSRDGNRTPEGSEGVPRTERPIFGSAQVLELLDA